MLVYISSKAWIIVQKSSIWILVWIVFVLTLWLFIAGDVIGALCTAIGPSVLRDIRDTVLLGVRKNLETSRPYCDKSGNSSELSSVSEFQ